MPRRLLVIFALCLSVPMFGQGTPPVFTNVNASTGLQIPASGGTYRGAAWADFDGDGRIDVFAPEGGNGPIRWWRNLPNGTFAPQTVVAAGGLGRGDQGCIAADVDNDGDPDVFLCQTGFRRCMLFINDGLGNFSEQATVRGVDWLGYAMAATFGDYDRDGWLDLFVSEWNFNGATHQLFRNTGQGYFVNVTAAAGVALGGASYAAVFCDFDQDHWPDIFATRDNTGPNVMFHNNGDGTFTDVAPAINAADQLASMCVTVGDLHNDGDWDYFVSNISNHALLEWDRNVGAAQVANNTFWGVAQNYGLIGGWAWGGEFFDYDNDGCLDLFYNCIFQFNRLFKGSGSTVPFVETSNAVGMTTALPPSYGLAIVDYDNDGNLDLFNSSGATGGQLARNPGFGGNWLRISLVGTISNRDAIGAVVIAKSASGTRRRMVTSGEGFLCENDRRVHFGLGSDTVVNEIEIRWPRGSVQYLSNVPVNQAITITEPHFVASGTLGPGSTNVISFSPTDENGRFYLCGFSAGVAPPVVLPDGRRINVPYNDGLLAITTQIGNPWFGPPTGIVPATGVVSAQFNVPNLPFISGATAFAIAVAIDPASPGFIRTIVGPQPFVIP